MSTVCYELSEKSRTELMEKFPPKYSKPYGDHITLDVGGTDEMVPASPKKVEVLGIADDGNGLEAMIVRVDGSLARPSDGKIFHCTWSLEPDKTASIDLDILTPKDERKEKPYRPVHSNGLVSQLISPDGSMLTPPNPNWTIKMFDEPITIQTHATVQYKEPEKKKIAVFAKEFDKALMDDSQSFADFIERCHKDGTLAQFLPEVEKLWSMEEKKEFHPEGNSGNHTLCVLRALEKPNPQILQAIGLDADEKPSPRLKLAMLLHDIGKVYVNQELVKAKNINSKKLVAADETGTIIGYPSKKDKTVFIDFEDKPLGTLNPETNEIVDNNGNIIAKAVKDERPAYYDHEHTGMNPAYHICRRLNRSAEETNFAVFICSYHMLFKNFPEKTEDGVSNPQVTNPQKILELSQKIPENYVADWYKAGYADAMGRIATPEQHRKAAEFFVSGIRRFKEVLRLSDQFITFLQKAYNRPDISLSTLNPADKTLSQPTKFFTQFCKDLKSADSILTDGEKVLKDSCTKTSTEIAKRAMYAKNNTKE